jgi:HEAT repeat protein
MIGAYKASIARIFSHSGNSAIGAAFLVSDKHLFTCASVVAQALSIPQNISETPPREIYLEFPISAPGEILTARVLLWRPTHEENVTVLELTSPPPQTVQPVAVLVADDVWQHSFQLFGFPRRQKEGTWASGIFQEEQANGWIPLKASKESPASISSGFSGTPVWDEQERAVVGMVIVPQEPSGTRGAFAIPTIKLLRAWPELRQPLLQALRVYLEALASRLARLPDYFPPHLDIDRMHQPIRVRWNPPPLRPEVAQAREAARHAGYFDEGERVFHWQGPWMYEQPKEQYGGGALDAGKIRRGTPMSWHRFRHSIRRAIILGDPGCGKSWLLQYEAYQVAREQLAELQQGEHLPDSLLLPVYLPLTLVAEELANGASDLPEAIGRVLQHVYTLSEQDVAWFKQQLVGPRCLLLLDALDEVAPEQRAQLLESLSHFAQQARCRILLTSRTAGYLKAPFPLRGNRDEFEFEFEFPQNRHECTFEVMPFERKQVTDFIERWFVANPPRGKRLLERLNQEPTLRAFSRMPLQLALLCLIASEREDTPIRRVKLYEAAQSLLPPRAQLLYPPFYAYLVARALADQPVEQWREQVLARCWFDPTWEGVIELLAGCLKDPNPLLEALLNEPYDVFHTMLLLAGRCLVEAEQACVKQDLQLAIIEQLITVMCSLSARDRRQAALVLGQLGEVAVPKLLAALKDTHEQIEARCAAAEALGISGSTRMLADLLAIVRDQEDYREVRAMATWALGQLGDARTEEPLLAALQDKFWEVRAAAAEALWHASTPQTIAALLAVLQDEHAGFGLYGYPKRCEVQGAVEALRHIGEPAIQALLQDLSSRNSRVRWQAIHAIGQLGNPKAIQALQGILRDKNERTKIRATTAWALGEIGDGQSVETLVKTARDASEHEAIRLLALGALGDIGDGQVVEEILPALQDRASEVRCGAVIALRGLGHARALAGLVRALQDRRESVREGAAWALGWLGDARAVPALLLALQRERQWAFTRYTAWALGQIGDARATGDLLQALRGEALRSMTREAAAEALSHIRSAHEATEAVLVAPWYRGEWGLEEQTMETLGRIGSPSSIETLLTIIHDQLQQRHLRRAAILALRHTCDMQTTRELMSILLTANWDEQSYAFRPLADHLERIHVVENSAQAQDVMKGVWNRHHNERLKMAAELWELAERVQLADTVEHVLRNDWRENQSLFRATRQALESRIQCTDPIVFSHCLLDSWSSSQGEDDAQAAVYELLACTGPRLYHAVRDTWLTWRMRLTPLTAQVVNQA